MHIHLEADLARLRHDELLRDADRWRRHRVRRSPRFPRRLRSR